MLQFMVKGDFNEHTDIWNQEMKWYKKAERFFKERGIKYQFIDMKEKGMSKGEFNSVAQVNGGIENMINWDGKDKDTLALIKYIPFRYTFRSASSNAS